MKICIIIPLYNESSRFEADEFKSFVESNDILFCLVNDGSTDATQKMIEGLSINNDKIFTINSSKNIGKAEAVRAGVNYAISTLNCETVGYFDADFATPLTELNTLISYLKNEHYKFIMGSRVKRLGANIKRFKWRHFSGRFIATIISEFILNLPVYDTQCGAKIIDSSVAKIIFEKEFLSKWLFDVELIARLKNHYGIDYCRDNIYEVPLLKWVDKGNSKITFIDALSVPLNLIKLYAHYK